MDTASPFKSFLAVVLSRSPSRLPLLPTPSIIPLRVAKPVNKSAARLRPLRDIRYGAYTAALHNRAAHIVCPRGQRVYNGAAAEIQKRGRERAHIVVLRADYLLGSIGKLVI